MDAVLGEYGGRVHLWQRQGVQLRSLCEGITALASVVQLEGDMRRRPQCEICRKAAEDGPSPHMVCLRPDDKTEDGVREEWLCGRKKCVDAYNEEADVEVLETDADGKPLVVRKEKDTTVLHAGQYVKLGANVWQVVRVRHAGADVRGVMGPRTGYSETWSRSSAGHVVLTHRDVEALRAAAREKERAEEAAKTPAPAPTAAPAAPPRKRGQKETPEDVKRVLELRAEGLAYHVIEERMGWPNTKGGRPWRIVKAHERGEL